MRDAGLVKGKFLGVTDGQLVFTDMTVPAAFSVSRGMLSDWVGRTVEVLLVDGVAVQLRRSKVLGQLTVKYPRDV